MTSEQEMPTVQVDPESQDALDDTASKGGWTTGWILAVVWGILGVLGAVLLILWLCGVFTARPTKEEAAVKIQAAARGWKARRDAAEMRRQKAERERAAVHIQAAARGWKARRDVAAMRRQKVPDAREEEQELLLDRNADVLPQHPDAERRAAVTIQRRVRGNMARAGINEPTIDTCSTISGPPDLVAPVHNDQWTRRYPHSLRQAEVRPAAIADAPEGDEAEVDSLSFECEPCRDPTTGLCGEQCCRVPVVRPAEAENLAIRQLFNRWYLAIKDAAMATTDTDSDDGWQVVKRETPHQKRRTNKAPSAWSNLPTKPLAALTDTPRRYLAIKDADRADNRQRAMATKDADADDGWQVVQRKTRREKRRVNKAPSNWPTTPLSSGDDSSPTTAPVDSSPAASTTTLDESDGQVATPCHDKPAISYEAIPCHDKPPISYEAVPLDDAPRVVTGDNRLPKKQRRKLAKKAHKEERKRNAIAGRWWAN